MRNVNSMIYDFAVIGAGISGASVAAELCKSGSVIVLEAESSPGYHSTGRSAALFTPNYGPELVRKISRLSYDFLKNPPEGFTNNKLLAPRGMMSVAMGQPLSTLNPLVDLAKGEIELIDQERTLELAPFLNSDSVRGAAYERAVEDIDVASLHQGFLKVLSRSGGLLRVDMAVKGLSRHQGVWNIAAGDEILRSRVVINAAGAWADCIGRMAGLRPIQLSPKRRSAILVDAPLTTELANVPAMDFVGVDNYIKPEKTRLMVSPGDAVPVAPQDIQVDDYDIAVLVDWLESATSICVGRIDHQWAGLRSFVPDGLPVVGFDSEAEGFFWLAAQGGYGIMMAPSLGRLSAELILRDRFPEDFIDVGIKRENLSPARIR